MTIGRFPTAPPYLEVNMRKKKKAAPATGTDSPLLMALLKPRFQDPCWQKLVHESICNAIIDLRKPAKKYKSGDYIFKERVDTALAEHGFVQPFAMRAMDKAPKGSLVLIEDRLGVLVFDPEILAHSKPSTAYTGFAVLNVAEDGRLEAYGDLWGAMGPKGPGILGPVNVSDKLKDMLSSTVVFSQALLIDAIEHQEEEPIETMHFEQSK